MRSFARREFVLMLLRRMDDYQPELVEAAYTGLGAARTDYLAAHHRWQQLLRSRRSPRGLELYRATIGPPDTERPVPYGDLTLTACAWTLPGPWPDLRWEATIGTDGFVLHAWLVRADPAAAPGLAAPDRVAPWSAVVDDVTGAFPGARQLDPEVPGRWVVRADSGGTPYDLVFVHGLYQVGHPAGASTPRRSPRRGAA
ncbi:hypothetical protein Cs7R123_17140 [Catellatospora sp. TT07R-123]|uniref:hypothetical protein n=1 Tax=Catellatospora sp. TT07R-123 TaxID=2733863 RepID=UPI001B1C71E1|nr:hypothetical protein [Catellatospora sp. TT07R-123]GHJ44372.1 hypothetical protein Cs7R123_17140 [Catellatospora sp. TT07R-123]